MATSHVILGAGPVGRAVVSALSDRGVKPTVVTRSGTAVPGAISRPADLTDPLQAAAAVAGADVIFQCAQPGYHRWPQEFPGMQASAVQAGSARRSYPSLATRATSRKGSQPWNRERPRRKRERCPSNM